MQTPSCCGHLRTPGFCCTCDVWTHRPWTVTEKASQLFLPQHIMWWAFNTGSPSISHLILVCSTPMWLITSPNEIGLAKVSELLSHIVQNVSHHAEEHATSCVYKGLSGQTGAPIIPRTAILSRLARHLQFADSANTAQHGSTETHP